jgi:hypothetical protein
MNDDLALRLLPKAPRTSSSDFSFSQSTGRIVNQ